MMHGLDFSLAQLYLFVFVKSLAITEKSRNFVANIATILYMEDLDIYDIIPFFIN